MSEPASAKKLNRKGDETNFVSPVILPMKGEKEENSLKEIDLDLNKRKKTIIPEIKKNNEIVVVSDNKDKLEGPKTTIINAALMMTNICLGTTIFTFAVRAKAFGLVWIIVAAILCAVVNYWTIVRAIQSSKNLKETDYSDIVAKHLGNKHKMALNIFIIVYSYGCLMALITLIYPLLGRFISSVGYRNTYKSFEDFNDAKWGKPYMKYPIVIGISICLIPICCLRDMSKLNWTAYIGVGSVFYTLLVVTIQCNDYFHYYKSTKYNKDIKSTHVNWVDLSKAFTKKLDFFKGMASLFAAYSCHTGIFPIFADFKPFADGLTKMKRSVFLSCCLTCVLHILSITVCFLTEPIDPEDIIIYRKQKDNSNDIPMNISKLAVAISLFFTIPGYYFGLRCSIANTFTGGKISRLFNILLTSISIIVCCIIGAVYDKILNYLNYIGGFFAVFVCYYYPIRIYIASTGKGITEIHNLIEYIGALLLVIIGIIAGIATIIDDVS